MEWSMEHYDLRDVKPSTSTAEFPFFHLSTFNRKEVSRQQKIRQFLELLSYGTLGLCSGTYMGRWEVDLSHATQAQLESPI